MNSSFIKAPADSPLRPQCLDRTVQYRSDVGFAQSGDARDGDIVDAGAVFQRYQFTLAFGKTHDQCHQSRLIRDAFDVLVGCRVTRDIERHIDRQMIAMRTQVVDANVLRDLDEPRGKSGEIGSITIFGAPSLFEY